MTKVRRKEGRGTYTNVLSLYLEAGWLNGNTTDSGLLPMYFRYKHVCWMICQTVIIFLLYISSSSSVGTGSINTSMWLRKNCAHSGQQSKLSGVFTAKIIQYLQIKLCTGVYGLLRGDCLECSSESVHRVGSCYVGG